VGFKVIREAIEETCLSCDSTGVFGVVEFL